MTAAADRDDRRALWLGGGLGLAYLLQAVLHLELPPLVALQAHDSYKIASGLLLVAFLGYQWALIPRRGYDLLGAVSRHKLVGAFAPLVLYIHATRIGYGYLGWLALSYLGTAAIGIAHGPVVHRRRARWLFTTWFIAHVAASLALVVLAGYHIVIALAYE